MGKKGLAGKVLLGNEAMARGIIEGGATVVTSYPGTPASEIMGAVNGIKKRTPLEHPYPMVDKRKGGLRGGPDQ